jgi:hypothetical protein
MRRQQVFQKEKEGVSQRQIMSLQQKVRTRILETCIEEYMNLRRVTNLQII